MTCYIPKSQPGKEVHSVPIKSSYFLISILSAQNAAVKTWGKALLEGKQVEAGQPVSPLGGCVRQDRVQHAAGRSGVFALVGWSKCCELSWPAVKGHNHQADSAQESSAGFPGWLSASSSGCCHQKKQLCLSLPFLQPALRAGFSWLCRQVSLGSDPI